MAMNKPFADEGYPNVLPPSRGYYVVFNAVSSAATILIGVLIGNILKSSLNGGKKFVVIAVIGASLYAAGLLLETWVPMVKKLWSASFALYAAGLTCWMMAFFFLVIDVAGISFWAFPFVVVGMNSIFIYFSAGIFNPTIRNLLRPYTEFPLKELGQWGPVVLATLVTFVQWLVCLFLYRNRIFFKV